MAQITLGEKLIQILRMQAIQPILSQVVTTQRELLNPQNIKDYVVFHLDSNLIGGLVDFPNAKVHFAVEVYNNFKSRTRDIYLISFIITLL